MYADSSMYTGPARPGPAWVPCGTHARHTRNRVPGKAARDWPVVRHDAAIRNQDRMTLTGPGLRSSVQDIPGGVRPFHAGRSQDVK